MAVKTRSPSGSERMWLRWRRHAVRALQPVRRYRPAARYFSSRLCGRGRRQDAAACLISDRRATPSSTCSPRPEHAESDVRRGDCRRRQTRRRPDCARAESSLAITRSRMGGQSVRCVWYRERRLSVAETIGRIELRHAGRVVSQFEFGQGNVSFRAASKTAPTGNSPSAGMRFRCLSTISIC